MTSTADPRPSPPAGDTTARAAYEAGRAAGRARWPLYLAGGVTMLLGALAVAAPVLGSLAATFLAGTALTTCGIVGLFGSWRRRDGWHLAAAFGLSLLAILAGVLMIAQPIAGILALTTLIIAYFAATGALRILYGARSRSEGGGWMIALGALSLLLAAMLTLGLPFSAAWVPGVLLGIDLILWGAMLIVLGLRAGRPEASKPLSDLTA